MKFLNVTGIILLFLLVCVSSTGASGIMKLHIPEISNAAVGDTVDATLYIDNNLNPLSSDIALDLDWNREIIQYVSTDFSTGHTNDKELIGTHQLTLRIADHTNGIPAGDVPAARIKFKVVGPGTSPIVVNIEQVLDLSGADITSRAVSSNGEVTTTSTASTTTTRTTATPTTATPTTATPTTATPTTATPTTATPTTATPTTATPTTATPTTATPTTASVTTTAVITTTATVTSASTTTASTQVQIINPSPATVPFNTGVFAIGSVGNVAVGQVGGATLYVNNAWSPQFGDTYIDITWDPSIAEYVSTDIRVSSNTTAAEGGNGRVRVALGDFRNGYPAGSYPIATINLRALKEGTTPLTVTIDHVRYWSADLSTFTDITASATAVSGVFSTGAVAAPTQTSVTTLPIGTVVTTATQYIVPSGPVSDGSSSSSSGGDVYTGVGGEPTARTTVTTIPTTLPTTVVTTLVTSEPTITIETTVPTTVQMVVPTTKKAGVDAGLITLAGLVFAGVLFLAGRRH